ncbi:major tail protein [Staphylococcus phage S-CoN_Ph11]|uniref:Major tail protein n=1 Tax=Staphylococcus phage CF9 TaxID=3113741 RepID=A0AAX4J771_9CAUD|nr:major tail protein [Staphylococcus phage S-CoN_Ph1]WNM51600.1 major tail protein [Staphylococcus phage S-CoN_Ph2]WNM51762.1 major tail protein [Staphylococcus phage S-CoN_Ph3]WNM51998.1 major tail protein [Staphylococcus phage S-CoN_Ph4]WNM52178.1 major tail protein [Staphylococcus phage S-CoN_Ph5]WNM52258.1 major tail protein [Staphylococcus phage S-CoN_Ph6]WNM52425.1 major tail protein [Staphylococcus phage S-CoN_Ph7]WNM52683.1 major tail protein [Staphylococcus phage S-CoN_Ph8]WNM5284
MASTIGFKRATFFIYDKDDKVEDTYVVEGKANKGGTTEASISGLSAEAVKVYASNVAYYVAQRGTGSVELSLSILDITDVLAARLLGRTENEDGIYLVGENTEPPYAGVLMESAALDGQPIFFALLKGKFRLDEQNLATNEDELSEPEADELEGQFVADAHGNTYATARGEDKREALKQLFYNIAGDGSENTNSTPSGRLVDDSEKHDETPVADSEETTNTP